MSGEAYALDRLRGLAAQLPARSIARHNDIENCAQLYARDLDRVRGATALLSITNDMMMGYKKPTSTVDDVDTLQRNPEPLFEINN
jgi:hypothetical protein